MSSQNRTNIPNSLNEHWMPFSDNKSFKKNPRLITDAKGVYLTNHEGKKMIDGSSGLFCNPLGHGRREITEAVTKQLEKLDYCQPFNQGFGGSFELATRIAKKTPGDLNKIFYTLFVDQQQLKQQLKLQSLIIEQEDTDTDLDLLDVKEVITA